LGHVQVAGVCAVLCIDGLVCREQCSLRMGGGVEVGWVLVLCWLYQLSRLKQAPRVGVCGAPVTAPYKKLAIQPVLNEKSLARMMLFSTCAGAVCWSLPRCVCMCAGCCTACSTSATCRPLQRLQQHWQGPTPSTCVQVRGSCRAAAVEGTRQHNASLAT